MSNHIGVTTEREFERFVESKRGLRTYWPQCYAYTLKNGHLRTELTEAKIGKKELRGLDPWGLAVAVEAMNRKWKLKVSSISFVIGGNVDVARPDLEALRRRVSFLAINNESLHFELVHAGCRQFEQSLYSKDELFNRPPEEVVHDGVSERSDEDKEGRLEKDFQTWLFGKTKPAEGIGNKAPIQRERTNERLAVLGEDFLRLKKKRLGIMREFPTGAFKGEVTEENRILPTDYVDMVTLNKHKILSVIELKVDDAPLEVISQILDYSLYFRCYAEQLGESSLKNLWDGRSNEIACYVAANHFHHRLDRISEYYSTHGKEYGFAINKVVLGYATELGRS